MIDTDSGRGERADGAVTEAPLTSRRHRQRPITACFVLGVIIINDSLERRYEPLKSFTDKSRLASGLRRRRAAAITAASAVRHYEDH